RLQGSGYSLLRGQLIRIGKLVYLASFFPVVLLRGLEQLVFTALPKCLHLRSTQRLEPARHRQILLQHFRRLHPADRNRHRQTHRVTQTLFRRDPALAHHLAAAASPPSALPPPRPPRRSSPDRYRKSLRGSAKHPDGLSAAAAATPPASPSQGPCRAHTCRLSSSGSPCPACPSAPPPAALRLRRRDTPSSCRR